LQLSVELRRVADDKRIANGDANLPLTEEWAALAKQPLDWAAQPEQPSDSPTAVEIAVPCTVDPKDTKAKFEAAGVIQPTCAKCRMPEYTDAARREKAQGSVKMAVVIDATGRAISVRVIQGAGYGFVEQAVKALRSWQFKPATKDGKPVAVCVVVETTFRLY
jgi:TonB family protein